MDAMTNVTATFGIMTIGCTLAGILFGFLYERYLSKVLTYVALGCGIVGVIIVGIVLFGDNVQVSGLLGVQEMTTEMVVKIAIGFLGLYLGFPKGQRWEKRIAAKKAGTPLTTDVGLP